MNNTINFQINDFGPINEANININKINIVAGQNASGKSSTSKLLYCFLRSCFSKKDEFAMSQVDDSVRSFIRDVYGRYGCKRPQLVNLKDCNPFKEYKEDEFVHFMDLSILEKYYQAKNDYNNFDGRHYMASYIENKINAIDEILEIIFKNDEELSAYILRYLLTVEFSTNDFNFKSKFSGIKNNIPFEFDMNLKDYTLESSKFIKINGDFVLEDVFYIDSFSFFERNTFSSGILSHKDYIDSLIWKNKNSVHDLFDDKLNEDIISAENKLKKIINGELVLNNGRFYFLSDNENFIDIDNTASGIKQIGLIQLLLNYRKLKKDSFLIIDEPEVNLHPEWQFKLAEILVVLSNELNITIYINTHSPMFIEAMEVFTMYYGLEDETNFYLTEQINNGKYNFVKYDYDNLFEIYDNLAKPFDAIEVYRLKAEYKKEKNE